MIIPADAEPYDLYRIFAGPTSKTLNDKVTNITCPLDNGKHFGLVSHGLGDLDKLPVELQSIILVQSDLQTLTDFRRVNRRAMEVVDALPEYRSIVQHSPASLRAILSVELGKFITCQKLYDTLCAANREGCRQPADFIYLLKCCRVCLRCLCWRIKYCPITTHDAVRLYAVPSRLLAELPTMRSIPGQFGAVNKIWPDRRDLVDAWSAYLIGSTYWAKHLHAQRAAYSRRPYSVPLPSIRSPATVPFQFYPEPNRFMATIRVPWIQDQQRKRR